MNRKTFFKQISVLFLSPLLSFGKVEEISKRSDRVYITAYRVWFDKNRRCTQQEEVASVSFPKWAEERDRQDIVSLAYRRLDLLCKRKGIRIYAINKWYSSDIKRLGKRLARLNDSNSFVE